MSGGAFRLEGREWRDRGELTVTGVGQPPALPAPQRKDGVLAGTGLFSASGRARGLGDGSPRPPGRSAGASSSPSTGTSAAYLSATASSTFPTNSGKKWRRSTWTPWGNGDGGDGGDGVVGMWRQGKDYWVDLPYGDHDGALRLAWFDQRVPSEEKILLTRLTQGGDWVRLAETTSDVRSRNEALGLTQILVPKGDTWVLLTGCVASKGTPPWCCGPSTGRPVRGEDGAVSDEVKVRRGRWPSSRPWPGCAASDPDRYRPGP